jgi:hypothetical protein
VNKGQSENPHIRFLLGHSCLFAGDIAIRTAPPDGRFSFAALVNPSTRPLAYATGAMAFSGAC